MPTRVSRRRRGNESLYVPVVALPFRNREQGPASLQFVSWSRWPVSSWSSGRHVDLLLLSSSTRSTTTGDDDSSAAVVSAVTAARFVCENPEHSWSKPVPQALVVVVASIGDAGRYVKSVVDSGSVGWDLFADTIPHPHCNPVQQHTRITIVVVVVVVLLVPLLRLPQRLSVELDDATRLSG
jgi:hypothetical protein